jgi:hypothetical protein
MTKKTSEPNQKGNFKKHFKMLWNHKKNQKAIDRCSENVNQAVLLILFLITVIHMERFCKKFSAL